MKLAVEVVVLEVVVVDVDVMFHLKVVLWTLRLFVGAWRLPGLRFFQVKTCVTSSQNQTVVLITATITLLQDRHTIVQLATTLITLLLTSLGYKRPSLLWLLAGELAIVAQMHVIYMKKEEMS
jgi:hypothetical protein